MTTFRKTAALATCLALGALAACQTSGPAGQTNVKDPVPPPPITATMPLQSALEAAIDFGGDTLADVKRLVKHRNEGEKAGAMLATALHDNVIKYEHNQLLNACHLYGSMPVPVSVPLFEELVSSDRPLARQVGWQLAAMKPSPLIAKAVDKELTRALTDGDEEPVLIPQMANAVRANRLRGAYTLMRQGLMAKGDEEFALAMITLEPKRSSNDFLDYLALAPAEELRQLTLSSVNLYLHGDLAPPPVPTARRRRGELRPFVFLRRLAQYRAG